MIIVERKHRLNIIIIFAVVAVISLGAWLWTAVKSAYASQLIDQTSTTVTHNTRYEVGDIGPAGGVIFYVENAMMEETYYEVAPRGWMEGGDGDVDPMYEWGCRGMAVGADGLLFVDGVTNTSKIVDFHNDSGNFNGNDYYTYQGRYDDFGCTNGNDGSVAAKVASEAVINGFNDWHLPSFLELNYLTDLQDNETVALDQDDYWSSTESASIPTDFANSIHYSESNGGVFVSVTHAKEYRLKLRPVRTFTKTKISTVDVSFQITSNMKAHGFLIEFCTVLENLPPHISPDECLTQSTLDATGAALISQSGADGLQPENFTENSFTIFSQDSHSFNAGHEISLTLDNIIDGTKYEYEARITPLNADGESIYDVKPEIYDVNAVAANDGKSATISWNTNKPASSQIMLGANASTKSNYFPIINNDPMTTSHNYEMNGYLSSCAKYYFDVASHDAQEKVNASIGYDFTTKGCAGSIISQSDKTIQGPGGGELTFGDISLTVPDGFTMSTATFQVKQLDVDNALENVGAPAGNLIVGNNFYDILAMDEFLTEINEFSDKPISITIHYSLDDMKNKDLSSLAIYHHDGSSWSKLNDCVVDEDAQTVTCSTVSFSSFALAANELIPGVPNTGFVLK